MDVRIKEIQIKVSAFEAYEALFEVGHFFLDSARDHDRLGRYSMIGLNPFKKLIYHKGILREDGHVIQGDPFDALDRLLRRYQVSIKSDLPFIGGAMGYFGYDLARAMEKLPDTTKNSLDIPDMVFYFYENAVVYDHHLGKQYVTALIRHEKEPDQIDRLSALLTGLVKPEDKVYDKVRTDFTSHFDQTAYMETVEAMRTYIRKGDVYIANLTHRLSAAYKGDGLSLYKKIREINPAPFAAYMPCEGFEILCASPERFMKIRRGQVETRPIKGTVPVGKNYEEDAINRRRLENSEKDKAELLMVVDLERNDLSKVCRPYTVKVTELYGIESYATVHHLVATVVGELKSNYSSVDLMKACFPGGSITGTPKIRAMEIIDELEVDKRSLYTGCLGYFGYNGDGDFNIVIRSFIKEGDRLVLGVGGGITWESDPASEYQETLDKAKAMIEAAQYRIIEGQ